MRKIILALSICSLIPLVSIAVAYADDEEDVELSEQEEVVDSESDEAEEVRAVGKRMSCADIKKEMDKLSENSELDETESVQLADLKTEYRSKCMKAAGRRAMGRAKPKANASGTVTRSEQPGVAPVNDNGGACETPDANGCCPGETYKDLGEAGFNCCTANDEHCFPPMKAKKETTTAVCDDGSKPDPHGCCTGEKYTDLGDLGFNCCLSDGVTCFPPMK